MSKQLVFIYWLKKKSLCSLFRLKHCSGQSDSSAWGELKNSTNLNKLMAKSSSDQVKLIVGDFEAKSSKRFYDACMNVYKKVYCSVLELIIKYSRNKIEYFGQKINLLLNTVYKNFLCQLFLFSVLYIFDISKNQPGYNLGRIFLTNSIVQDITKIEKFYQQMFKVSLFDHLDILYAKENIVKQNKTKHLE